MPSFQIPKQTDRALLTALNAIREDVFGEDTDYQIRLRTTEGPAGQDVILPKGEKTEVVDEVLAVESHVMPHITLRGPGKHIAISIDRKLSFYDDVNVAHDQNWLNALAEQDRHSLSIRIIASARKHLMAIGFDGALAGTSDSEWGQYRNAQTAVLQGLQETQRTILQEFTRKSLEMEASSKSRMEEREAELQKHYETLQEQLNQKYNLESERLAAREEQIKASEKNFNTKEARYVARSEQQKQIEQIRSWLEGWSLTRGTQEKRRVVIIAYVIAAAFTGAITVWFSRESMAVVTASAPQLAWWQWLLLGIKSLFPLAAFITIVIAFIRWSTDWAKQHADEEFRNRSRILDIGRTAWLLEAVRDAQDNNKELPPDLVKELSRNLFAYVAPDGSDLHPQAVSDMMMQGLNSLRVKTSDGSEIEAKRGKG
jgi:hypothetical protein